MAVKKQVLVEELMRLLNKKAGGNYHGVMNRLCGHIGINTPASSNFSSLNNASLALLVLELGGDPDSLTK